MKEINQEKFEAWLFSQPPEREFDYLDVAGGCAACAFIRETTNWHDAVGGSDERGVYRVSIPREAVSLPDWMKFSTKGVLSVTIKAKLTVANMQRRYRKLFPEVEAEASVKEAPALVSV